jgi:hypothetical protein
MFQRPKLSQLIYTKKQIIIHGFKSNNIHNEKFMPLDLGKISFKTNIDLLLDDLVIGSFQKSILHKDENSIYLYFTNKHPNLNLNNLFAYSKLLPKIIQCPSCKTFFNKNDQPCKCIKGAPFINVLEAEVIEVHLLPYRLDNEDKYDLRSEIYSEFFGGSLHNLTFVEPI